MSKISSRVQALIDRLTHIDPSRPRHDEVVVEQAIRVHFRALGVRRRPIVWVKDVRSGLRYVAEQARTSGSGSVALNRIDRLRCLIKFLLLIPVCGTLGAFAAFMPLGFFVSWLLGDRTGMILRGQFGPPALGSAMIIGVLVSAFELALVWLLVRNVQSRRAVTRPIEAKLLPLQPSWDAATEVATGNDPNIFDFDFWRHIHNNVPFAAHDQALREVYGPSIRHFTGSQACPMAEAFEAGLFLYWVRPREVVCVPQPILHIVNGRLHRVDGAAVEWATGEDYWFRRGAHISPPDSTT